jgi:hypothetical protein
MLEKSVKAGLFLPSGLHVLRGLVDGHLRQTSREVGDNPD